MLKLPNIGDIVVVDFVAKGKVLDIDYRLYTDSSLTHTEAAPASRGGELMFKLALPGGEVGWVLAAGCHEDWGMGKNGEAFYEQDARSPHLEELGYSMVGWLDGLIDLPDNSNLPEIVSILMAIQYSKETVYGSSWKGKGEYRGIMSNLDRKYDRLDTITQAEIDGKLEPLFKLEQRLANGEEVSVGESKVDAIADLTNYGLLYMTYVKEKFPRVFGIWVDRNVPDYLRVRIPFLQK